MTQIYIYIDLRGTHVTEADSRLTKAPISASAITPSGKCALTAPMESSKNELHKEMPRLQAPCLASMVNGQVDLCLEDDQSRSCQRAFAISLVDGSGDRIHAKSRAVSTILENIS
jgi:hypothetical protein